jgi:two-component system chemotaxis response regulator CheB
MKKNILVVDDSALLRRIICGIINSDVRFQAIDTCNDGLEAYEVLRKRANRYDAVILDFRMPRMDGLQLLERLHQEGIKVTVIMASTLTKEGASVTIRAMELGAVDVITKPENVIEAKGPEFRGIVLDKLSFALFGDNSRVASRPVKPAEEQKPAFDFSTTRVQRGSSKLPRHRQPKPVRVFNRLVALACSTGGPKALSTMIPMLDPRMDAPMVLVQHMPVGFTKSLAERLNSLSQVKVKEAEDGELLKKGVVYIAPGGSHLEVVSVPGGHRVHLSDEPPVGGLKPCANVMFRSLMKSHFDEITCVVMTGMGADGTEGIRQLDSAKPIYVISQDEASSVVYGMPRAVAEAGLSDTVVPLTSIADTIIKNVGVKENGCKPIS